MCGFVSCLVTCGGAAQCGCAAAAVALEESRAVRLSVHVDMLRNCCCLGGTTCCWSGPRLQTTLRRTGCQVSCVASVRCFVSCIAFLERPNGAAACERSGQYGCLCMLTCRGGAAAWRGRCAAGAAQDCKLHCGVQAARMAAVLLQLSNNFKPRHLPKYSLQLLPLLMVHLMDGGRASVARLGVAFFMHVAALALLCLYTWCV
jgi:hypothetical protein